MRKTKRMMAVALSATMVLASSLTAFAEGPLGTGNTEGAGSSEGHVEKELINVVLPTIPSGSTPFAYTMDPERLIQETSAAKYAEGTTFPDKDDDTGVYFLTGDNTYGNASNTLQVINKSSCDITLTVDVQATNVPEKTNIALDSKTSVKEATGAPKLYLGLKVGNSTQDVSTTKGTVKKVIAGVPENFKIAVDENDEYVYQESADATTWKAMNIQMEGEVTNLALADADVQAPTVTVTWSYDKATTEDGAVATDAVDYSTAPANVGPSADLGTTSDGVVTITKAQLAATSGVVTFDFGSGDDAVEAITSVTYSTNGTSFSTFSVANDWYSVNSNKLTVTSRTMDWITEDRYFRVIFDGDNTNYITLKFVAE